MTSVGSGALIGLALILLYRLSPRRVVGTDVFHAAVLLWTAGLAHWASGNVDLGLMAHDPHRVAPRRLDRDGAHAVRARRGPAPRPRRRARRRGPRRALQGGRGRVSPLAIVGVPALLGLLSFVVHRRRAAARAGARRRDGRAPAPAADRA